ncbi:hypothetical protein [Roseivivax sp. CAU 1761]
MADPNAPHNPPPHQTHTSTHSRDTHVEKRGGSSSMAFIVGGLVVAVAIIAFLFWGGDSDPDVTTTDAAVATENAAESAEAAAENAAEGAENAAEAAGAAAENAAEEAETAVEGESQ